jgi:DNA-binding transcriptional regulator LsrR (DeoR family)
MLQSRLKRVAARKPLLAASFAAVRRVCGQPSCHSHQGEKHLAHQLTYKVRGKTHTVYVPIDFTEEVRSWIQEHRRLKRLLQEITQLSLDLVRSHAQEQKRRRGRS